MGTNDQTNINDLPSNGQLIKSTIIAIIVAAIVLVTIVLPAEYAIDITGIGKVLGLQRMGEIKKQLAEEAEKLDEQKSKSKEVESTTTPTVTPSTTEEDSESESDVKSETLTATLNVDEGKEIKIEMLKGNKITYSWTTENGALNFDLHGESFDSSLGLYKFYDKGINETSGEGTIEADFDGNHGWFFRNRAGKDVTVTVEVTGDFVKLKEITY